MADDNVKTLIEQHFNALPQVVRDAIESGHIDEKFKGLAAKYHLHYDEWQKVENLIMLTVLGLSPAEDLVKDITAQTSIGPERADSLVDDVSLSVFKPIHDEMQRQLGHPEAQDEQADDVEKLRRSAIAAESESERLGPVGTPPAPPPAEQAIRAPTTGAYKPGGTSAERTGKEGVAADPYREQISL